MKVEPSESPRFFALDLADAFLQECGGGDPEGERSTREAALLVGEHLAGQKRPGEWQALDAAAFFRQVSHVSKHERIGYALALVGIYGWLGLSGQISPALCGGVIREIHAAAPQADFLDDLVRHSVPALEAAAAAYEQTMEYKLS
jgi:hypothetical protein